MGKAVISVTTELLDQVLGLDGAARVVGTLLPTSAGSIRFIIESDDLPENSEGHYPEAIIEYTKVFAKVSLV